MIGHLGLSVGDLDSARAYYGRLLPLVGFEVFLDAVDQVAYRPVGGKPGTYLFLYQAEGPSGYSPRQPGLQHLAFMVRTRGLVRQVHELAGDLGGEVVHPPQEWPQYPAPYFATFWRDPDGLLFEAVCHHDRD